VTLVIDSILGCVPTLHTSIFIPLPFLLASRDELLTSESVPTDSLWTKAFSYLFALHFSVIFVYVFINYMGIGEQLAEKLTRNLMYGGWCQVLNLTKTLASFGEVSSYTNHRLGVFYRGSGILKQMIFLVLCFQSP
jgi:hypothetical protein